jgi:non-specific serine/threonine protein kinase
MEETWIIGFDISYNEIAKHFLPNAYIALVSNNSIGYIEKRASIATVKSYDFVITEPLSKLLLICEELKIETLNKKYNAKNKVKKPLQDVLKENALAKIFSQYVSYKLNVFLTEIKKNDFPFAVDTDRSNPFGQHQKKFSKIDLSAKLQFKKREDLVVYALHLVENEAVFAPADKQTVVLLNEPAWVMVDDLIYNLNEINANKLTPFLKKNTVEILEKNSRLYFETFIKDIAKKVEIEAEGFTMIQKTEITKCVIKPYYYFLSDVYFLEVYFEYQDVPFSYTNKKKFHSSLVLNDDFQVIQTKRNFEEENQLVQRIASSGLQLNDSGFFSFNEKALDKYENIQLLIEQKSLLNDHGFEINLSDVEQKSIATDFGSISVQYEEDRDWFDVKMQIVCGVFSFPFVQIVSHLKSKNPFFELPNGTFFLIPKEWFSKYKSLVEFGAISNDVLQVKKSQFPIIEAISSNSNIEVPTKKYTKYQPSKNLKATLRNYQEDGVKWLLNHHNNNLGACLADDMGLGKTLQTLALLTHVKESLQANNETEPLDYFSEITAKSEPLKALIIVPSSLVFNWKNEGKKFAPFLKSISYTGADRKKIKNKLGLYDLIFTSYSIALKDNELFKSQHFRYLILDESQYIKNKNSKVFAAINQIPTDHKITLSGTPIENSLNDLWSQMQFINPDLLGTFAFFTKYYKIPIEKNKDETLVSELKNLINPYILRRTKEQVAKDLPPVSEQIFLSEMSIKQKAFYEQEKSNARNSLLHLSEDEPVNKLNVLNALTKLRQISNHPKLIDANSAYDSGKFEDVVAYLETLIKSKKKVLLFSSFVQHIDIYTEWCTKNKVGFCKLTGETATTARENEISVFQNNPDKLLFFISLKAGSVGLNLTAASYVVLLDPWWNPFAENQAIARAHRIGQIQNVTVVRFIAKDTVEEKILLLQKKKKELAETIIDINYLPTEVNQDLDYILD